ncbi:unnamed protein product [Haemonchus placei]|uniref:Ground-like domain-containing protein n=1 Tax=Haemonchus placei TaxID=6290 RepID=A0A0N4WY31_HAEPC|nr:unnamed protein product [Haemonchus placei]
MRLLSAILLLTVTSSYGTNNKIHDGDVYKESHRPHTRKVREQQFQIQGVDTVEEISVRDEPTFRTTVPSMAGERERKHIAPMRPPPIFFQGQPRSFPYPQSLPQDISMVKRQSHAVASDDIGPRGPVPGYGPTRYYYPPRQYLPLRKCFYNPTGYVCCNEILNDLMVETFAELEARPKFHACNIQAVANVMQERTETKFNTSFELIVAYDDFAQKVHFSGDLICKVELGGRYALAYATARTVQEYQLPPINNRPQQGPITDAAHARIQTHTMRI